MWICVIFMCITQIMSNEYSFPFRYESESESCSAVSYSLWPNGLYSPWNSPAQNTRVGSLPLLLGIFPTQESNPDLPHCRWILYQLSYEGSPLRPCEPMDCSLSSSSAHGILQARILEWVFSRGSSQPRDQAQVSWTAGRSFTVWATREALPPGTHYTNTDTDKSSHSNNTF